MKQVKQLQVTALLILSVTLKVYSQEETHVKENIVVKFISIDSLRKVQYLEDLLDSFPLEEYYIYYGYVLRSGKGFITTTTVLENTPPEYRRPYIQSLFENNDHPVKPGLKYVFDRIHMRRFKDKNDSEPWPYSLELIVTN